MRPPSSVRIFEGRIAVEAWGREGWRTLEPVGVDLGVLEPALVAWAEPRPGMPLQIWNHRDRVGRYSTRIRVPASLATDFASIPVLAQIVMGPKVHYRLAGLIHDALYRWQAPRQPSDAAFRLVAVAGENGVEPWRGDAGYAALRAFGGRAYRRYSAGAA